MFSTKFEYSFYLKSIFIAELEKKNDFIYDFESI